MDNIEVENASPIYDYLKQYIPEFDTSGYSEDELINSYREDIKMTVAFDHGRDEWKMNVEVNQDFDMDSKALKIVSDYITECILDLRNLIYVHPDKSDPPVKFSVYTVWKTKTLQNWKYCISSTLYDDMYYELTYNGDKKEWYLDAYKKFENKVIKE